MRKLFFDTDVIIDFLRGHESAKNFLLKYKKEQFFLSTMTVAELFVGIRNNSETIAINSLLSSFNLVSIDTEIAKAGGIFRRKYGKSHGVGLADALIAAAACAIDATLVTLNKKHYPMLDHIIVPYSRD